MVSSCLFSVVVHLPKFGSQCEEPCESYSKLKWRFRKPGHLNARPKAEDSVKNRSLAKNGFTKTIPWTENLEKQETRTGAF